MESSEQKDAAFVHWVVAGAFSAAPAGRRFVVTPETLAQHMAEAKLTRVVSVKDRLGSGDKRTFELAFDHPRAFNAAELTAKIPALAALKSLAEDLGSNDVSRRPLPEAIRQRITDAVGSGKLLEAAEAALAPAGAAPPPAAAPAAEPAAPAATASVEEILEQKKTAPATTSAVDSFVRAVRAGGGGSKSVTPSGVARTIRNLVEEAVFGTANDILSEPTVARWEGAWRGLKLLVDQCPPSSGIAVEVVDVASTELPDAAFAEGGDDEANRPDAYFLVDAVDEVARLTEIASAAEGALAPFVVSITPAFFGAATSDELRTRTEAEDGGVPDGWASLRADESSRWLCVLHNPFVVASEGSGAARRVAFGSPVFALATMLSASYRETGAFARIRGSDGALKAPGTWDLPAGKDAGTMVPTQGFCSINLQSRLAGLGVLGLGSGKNADKIMLSTAPTARHSADAVGLPAQILTGRIVRFGQWVRDQIPQGAAAEDVKALFEQAASVFLFPGLQEGAGLRAEVGKGADGKPAVLIQAAVKPQFAGSPFQMAFELPLKS